MSWRLDEAGLRAFGEESAWSSAGVGPSQSLSYRTFAGRAVAVAEQLVAMGVRAGDPVALVSKARGGD
ncbi:MAG TPA: hypothetical protein ENK57_15860, partial [Polyangiaceae bacterium]|nr:hypothetical protein [Polyangiaceae bacterium]